MLALQAEDIGSIPIYSIYYNILRRCSLNGKILDFKSEVVSSSLAISGLVT